MKDEDKGTYFQPGDWMQYWSTAMHDWQRAYTWATDAFAQRAEQMGGMRGGPAWSPEDLKRMWSQMMENWTRGMGSMPGMNMPGGSEQQQITGCASQAYFATMT